MCTQFRTRTGVRIEVNLFTLQMRKLRPRAGGLNQRLGRMSRVLIFLAQKKKKKIILLLRVGRGLFKGGEITQALPVQLWICTIRAGSGQKYKLIEEAGCRIILEKAPILYIM